MFIVICRKCGAALKVGTPAATVKALAHFDKEDGTNFAAEYAKGESHA